MLGETGREAVFQTDDISKAHCVHKAVLHSLRRNSSFISQGKTDMQVFPKWKVEPAAEDRINSSTDIKKIHYVCLPPSQIIMYNLIMQLEAVYSMKSKTRNLKIYWPGS